jgi:hypothetical protein
MHAVRAPMRSVLSMLAFAVVAGALPADATHLPDHRFLVLGFVTDGEGRPVAGARVVVLHLHDENQGEPLGLDAKGVKGEVRARFDPHDKKVERGTRVDVRADRLVENRSAFAETLRSYLSR